MRQARLKAKEGSEEAHYHCISRVVGKDFLLGPVEREKFVDIMRRYEVFCGVRVITYCILSNHFHILVAVPPRHSAQPVEEVALLQRLKLIRGQGYMLTVKRELEQLRRTEDEAQVQAYLEKYYRQMGDISWFMRLVKQRFSQWYNHHHQRKGTLWEERFKSVMVDGQSPLLAIVAAYIDLNSVRAGLVNEPADYRWSGYGAAAAGDHRALKGIHALHQSIGGLDEGSIMAEYRIYLFGQGEERGLDEDGKPLRRGVSQDALMRVIKQKGRLEPWELVRLRVRYFVDGGVIGSKSFVEKIFQQERWRYGNKRRCGAHPIPRGREAAFFTLRNLQVRAFSEPHSLEAV